jgi:hypothetical protein
VQLAAPEASVTAEQPLRFVPLEVKATVPAGASPVTVAVNVTACPPEDGFTLDTRVVADTALLTTCDKAVLVLVT